MAINRHISQHRIWIISGVTAAMLVLGACSRQTAEEKGKELATEKLDIAKGIGTAVEEKGAAAAESLAGGLGQVVRGAGKGMEKSGRTIVAGPALTTAGLQVTRVQNVGANPDTNRSASAATSDPVHGLEVYVIADKPAQGHLRVTVFNLLDQEIGRAKVAVKRAADEAAYETVPLDARIPLSDIAKVSVEFQPEAAKP